jgi:hypothetical protein
VTSGSWGETWWLLFVRVIGTAAVIAAGRQWHVLAWVLIPWLVVNFVVFAAVRGYLDGILGPYFNWLDGEHGRRPSGRAP